MLKSEAIDSQSKTTYIRFSESDDNQMKVEQVSKEDFGKRFIQDSISRSQENPIEKSNSWLKLRLEAYTSDHENYNLVGGYTWLKDPVCTFSDVFALGHDATSTFNTSKSRSYHQSPWHGPTTTGGPMVYQDKDSMFNGNDGTHCKSDVSGVAYKFDLQASWCYHPYSNDPEYGASHHPFGLIWCDCTLTSPSAGGNVQLSYVHQEVSFPYNIQDAVNFLTTGKVDAKIIGAQDEFTVGDRIGK